MSARATWRDGNGSDKAENGGYRRGGSPRTATPTADIAGRWHGGGGGWVGNIRMRRSRKPFYRRREIGAPTLNGTALGHPSRREGLWRVRSSEPPCHPTLAAPLPPSYEEGAKKVCAALRRILRLSARRGRGNGRVWNPPLQLKCVQSTTYGSHLRAKSRRCAEMRPVRWGSGRVNRRGAGRRGRRTLRRILRAGGAAAGAGGWGI